MNGIAVAHSFSTTAGVSRKSASTEPAPAPLNAAARSPLPIPRKPKPSLLAVATSLAPYGGSGIGFARLLKPLQFARNRVVMLGIPPVDGDLLFGNDATGGQDK